MAMFDAFLKIDGVNGEIKGEIQLESFSWGVSNTSTIGSASGGAGAGKVVFQDFSFTSKLGKQSPQLFMHAVQGTSLRTADLTISAGRGQAKISFSDVFISSYKQDMTHQATVSGDTSPLEMVSLNFAKIEIDVSSLK
jgi:type VI secretion system secreted protein Hcp